MLAEAWSTSARPSSMSMCVRCKPCYHDHRESAQRPFFSRYLSSLFCLGNGLWRFRAGGLEPTADSTIGLSPPPKPSPPSPPSL